jgi:hypothetical protein
VGWASFRFGWEFSRIVRRGFDALTKWTSVYIPLRVLPVLRKTKSKSYEIEGLDGKIEVHVLSESFRNQRGFGMDGVCMYYIRTHLTGLKRTPQPLEIL